MYNTLPITKTYNPAIATEFDIPYDEIEKLFSWCDNIYFGQPDYHYYDAIEFPISLIIVKNDIAFKAKLKVICYFVWKCEKSDRIHFLVTNTTINGKEYVGLDDGNYISKSAFHDKYTSYLTKIGICSL